MNGFINAVGDVDSTGRNRSNDARGLLKFGGKQVIAHTLDRFEEIGISDPVLLYVNPGERRLYESALKGSRLGFNVHEYGGPTNPLLVYFSGMKILQGDHTLIVADDNLFDFSLVGLIEKFRQVDDNTLAARTLGDIINEDEARDLNFGTCVTDGNGKLTRASYSFDPTTRIDARTVILDIYLIHKKRTQFFIELLDGADLGEAANTWWRDFYAWVPKTGFWADVGKPQLHEKAVRYFNEK